MTPQDITIRPATAGDIPAIHAMAEVVFRKTYGEILSPEQMEFMMDWMYSEQNLARQMDEGNRFFLAEGPECEPLGYVSFRRDGTTDDGRERFHLEKLYVMPAAQGTGLGRVLFGRIVEEVRSLSAHAPRLELNVNRYNPAVSFYEHLGMHRDRSGDFPIGHGFYMNDYIMALDL